MEEEKEESKMADFGRAIARHTIATLISHIKQDIQAVPAAARSRRAPSDKRTV